MPAAWRVLALLVPLVLTFGAPATSADSSISPFGLDSQIARTNTEASSVLELAFQTLPLHSGWPGSEVDDVISISRYFTQPAILPESWVVANAAGPDGYSPGSLPLGEKKSNAKNRRQERRDLVPLAHIDTLRPTGSNMRRLSFAAPSLAPMAFVKFCLEHPQECEDSPEQPSVSLTAERWGQLVAVNRRVNDLIVPQANENGVLAEQWSLSPKMGDCNDYAVTKRHELLAQNWPSHALLLTETVVASGEHHLVLVVRTDEGDFVLDNLNANVRPISQVRYRWVRAQQAGNTKFWSAVHIERLVRVASR